jgi:rhamnosyltransferase
MAKRFGVRLVEIHRNEFNYSKTLNIGIEQSSGELILIVSAHVLPREDDWLDKMISHFSDDSVAGVYCRQVPRAGADWREALRLEKQFGADSIHFSKAAPLDGLSSSNAASCIRKSIWRKHNFVVMPAAEDREWAHWAIQNDYTIVYEARASVYHSHKEAARDTARRLIAIEKAADTRLGHKRTRVRTLKQACGLAFREIKEIFAHSRCKGTRVRSCAGTFATAFWYAVDFND